jgi:predicted nucleotidyltransferase
MRRLEDIAAIPTRDKEVLREVRQIIHRLAPGATVYLYGSGARGSREQDSDLDILVLTENQLSRSEEAAVAEAVYELELARGVVISILHYREAEWDTPLIRATPFRTRVEAEAVLI